MTRFFRASDLEPPEVALLVPRGAAFGPRRPRSTRGLRRQAHLPDGLRRRRAGHDRGPAVPRGVRRQPSTPRDSVATQNSSPSLLGQIKIGLVEVTVASGPAKRGSHLGVGDPARQRSITSVPDVGGQLASIFFDQQFYKRAGVKIDESHRSATLLAYQFSHGPAGPQSPNRHRRRQNAAASPTGCLRETRVRVVGLPHPDVHHHAGTAGEGQGPRARTLRSK